MLPRILRPEASRSHQNGKETTKSKRRNRRMQEDVPEIIMPHHYGRQILGNIKKSVPKYFRADLDYQETDKRKNIFKATGSGDILRDAIKRRHSVCTSLADVRKNQPVLIRNNHISLRKYNCPDLRSQLVSTTNRLQATNYELNKVYEISTNVRASVAAMGEHEWRPANLKCFSSKAMKQEEKSLLDLVKNKSKGNVVPCKKTGTFNKQFENLKVPYEIRSDPTAVMNDVVPKPNQKVASVSNEDTRSQFFPEWLDKSDLSYTGEVRNRNHRCVSPKFQQTRGRDSIVAWLQDVSL